MKKVVAGILAASMALACAACGSSASSAAASAAESTAASAVESTAESTATGDKVYHVGILQQLEHEALNAATEGFEAALTDLLGDKVEFDYQNAANDPSLCSTIATKFVSDKADLIMANATTALQSAAAATADIPIVGTSITDYVTAGVVESNDAPGGNVTGASDLAPVDQQIALLTKLAPDAKNVAILYCSSEPNSVFQATLAEKELDALGITWKEYTAADSNEIQSVVTNMVNDGVDAVYIPTDNTLADNMEIVKNVTVPAKLPVVCGEENMCGKGGLATLSISYYDMGYAAGKMAYEIMVNGADPATMPISYVSDGITEKYNPEVAEAIGWTIPDGMTAIEQ